MQRGRGIVVAAAALAVVSLLFPFLHAETLGSVSGLAAHALLPVLALIGAAIVVAVGDRRESLHGLPAVATAVAVSAAALLTGAIMIDAELASRDAAEVGSSGSIGSGLWLMAVAAALGVVGLIAAMSRRLS